MSPVAIGLGIAQYAAPKLAKWIFGEDGEDIAKEVVETAKTATGESDETKLLEALKADPEALLTFQRQAQSIEVRRLEADTQRLESVNATMRAEYAAEDKLVKRWRPVFGYCMAATWVIQIVGTVGAMIYAIIWEPANADKVLKAVAEANAAMATMWAVGLSVVGVSVWKRSEDKKTAAGIGGPGALGAIARKITGGGR